jgi:hypothetical protein
MSSSENKDPTETSEPKESEKTKPTHDDETPTPSNIPKPKIGLSVSNSQVAKVAVELIHKGTIINLCNNIAPEHKMIRLKPEPLLALFTNTVKPIIYANARNLGINDFTIPNNQIRLNNITFTVCVSAIKGLRAVIYNKAMRIDNATLALFGNRPKMEEYSFPALTTLLINSCGPITRTHESYRCIFIPYITHQDVEDLKTSPHYFPNYLELFTLALNRAHYSIRSTDIDLYNKDQSHWWTLHVVALKSHEYEIKSPDSRTNSSASATTDPLTQTVKIIDRVNVYSPMSFKDIDHATTFASICLDETLYDLPGPCYTSTFGPFVTDSLPVEIADIPAPFDTDLCINISPPVRLTTFSEARALTNIDAVSLGMTQNDTDLVDTVSPSVINPNRAYNQYRVKIDETIQAHLAPEQGQMIDPRNPYGMPRKFAIDPVYAEPDMHGKTMYYGTNLYFDHQMLNNYEKEATQLTIKEANKPTPKN